MSIAIAIATPENIETFVGQKIARYENGGVSVKRIDLGDLNALINDFNELDDFTKLKHRFYGKPSRVLDIHRKPTSSWIINISGDSLCQTKGANYVLVNPQHDLALLFACDLKSGTAAIRLAVYLGDFAIDLDCQK